MIKTLLFFLSIVFCSSLAYSQNNALQFDGVDDKVVVNNNSGFNSTSSLTVEAWIYANNWKAQQWQGTVVGHDGSNSSGYALRCGANGKLSFVVGNGGWAEVSSGPVMVAQTWNHVAGVINNGKIFIYINGNVI
ncbi:MAG: LamG domain-containing protein, partial [Owenweeksia sp.]